MPTDNKDDQNLNKNDDQNQDDPNKNQKPDTSKDDPALEELVNQRVDARLKDIKGKLDKVYEERDTIKGRLKEFEDKERAAEIKRLQDEGKLKEAHDLEMQEIKKDREALQKKVTELTRDTQVRQALAGLKFRNARAEDIAVRTITEELILSSDGEWRHKSGKAIRDFVKSFAEDEEQSFLFAPKANSGGGSGGGSGGSGNTSNTKKSLFEMSQEEVLELARQGKLPRRR